MLTSDYVAKEFEQELLSRTEEERIIYLRQLGFSIAPIKGVKSAIAGNYSGTAEKKARRTPGSTKKRVAGSLQAN